MTNYKYVKKVTHREIKLSKIKTWILTSSDCTNIYERSAKVKYVPVLYRGERSKFLKFEITCQVDIFGDCIFPALFWVEQ